MSETREVLNVRQLAAYLGVTPDSIYKYVTAEKLPAFRMGNRWRFKKALIDQWMEARSNAFLTRTTFNGS